LFGGLIIWEAIILGVVLAPTDAGLGQEVVTNPKIPVRIRQALNIESGLNDGLAMPVLLIAVSLVESTERTNGMAYWLGTAVSMIAIGAAAGIGIGFAGIHLIQWASDRRWMTNGAQMLSGVLLAVMTYAVAETLGGNGFIAAFCMGVVAANSVKPASTQGMRKFGEIEVELLMTLTFMVVFGVVMLPKAIGGFTGAMLLYALLSLVVIRPLTVAISLVGSRLHPLTVGFIGWFGPRGIASILYLYIVMETDLPGMSVIYGTAMLTVLISVFAHGVTAAPASKWYSSQLASKLDADSVEMRHTPELPVRHPAYRIE